MQERVIATLQYASFGAGACLISLVAMARLDAEVGRQSGVETFTQAAPAPDQSLWSPERVKGYESSLAVVTDAPVAILRIPDLGLEVPIFDSASELHLNRGAGLIAGMGLPDKGGNLGIAGHRDGYFRVLKDIAPGQRIEVETRGHKHRFRVVSAEIVESTNLAPLADTVDPTVTLVTCYPFYFIGSAPKRFVVRGVYEWT